MSLMSNKSLKPYTKAAIVVALSIAALLIPAYLVKPASAITAVDNLGILQMGTATGAAHIQPCTGDSCGTGLAWSQIFGSTGNVVTLGSSGITAVFIADQISPGPLLDNTTYSGAGTSNKNSDPISSQDPCVLNGTCDNVPLLWASGNLPSKDDLSNVYSFAANAPNNDLVVYSGFERISPSGDSHIDIGLFQSPVSLNLTQDVNNACAVARCTFIGHRTVGDIIVSMDFLKGGAVGNFTVREWLGSAFSAPVVVGLGEGCNPTFTSTLGTVPAGAICVFNNGSNIASGPWPTFDSHANLITTIPTNGFTNFGLDINQILGKFLCISTVIGQTRSSGSFTAELKDFAGPTPFPICTARITIAPNAVNEVGVRHTFTITFSEVIGKVLSPVPNGTKVTVTLTNGFGASFTNVIDNCKTTGTVNGVCTVSFTSFTAGTVTGTATGTVTFGGATFTVTTNGQNGNSGPAVKRFVDSFITITPNGVNSINEPHTFVATVFVNRGLGAGFVQASSASINITLTAVPPLLQSDVSTISTTCGSSTPGSCSTTFTSSAAGNVTGTATTTVTVDGVTMTRTTNGGANSPPAHKKFVPGSLAWTKVDNVGNLLAGSTFKYCLVAKFITTNPSGTTGIFQSITPVCNTVTDNMFPDQNPVGGKFLVVNLTLGTWTVQEIAAPSGFIADTRIDTVNLTVLSPNATITPAFSNPRPILKLTGFGYTNTPTSIASQCPPGCTISGTATYSLTVTNFGGADALLSANFTVAISVPLGGTGTLACPNNLCVLSLSNVLVTANGGTVTRTFTIQYTGSQGVAITASLVGSYTTSPSDGFVRIVNGTPATISFTVQPN